jgi:pimeloyl-ACP methyl ester carboxylesterase
MWLPAARELADLPVLLADLPGAGLSGLTPPSLTAAAEALADTLTAAGHPRWIIAGVSMGGYVAMAMARTCPDSLAGLALIDTKPNADDDVARQSRLALARRVLRERSVEPVVAMASGLVGPTTRSQRPQLVSTIAAWIADQDPAGVAWAQTAMAARPDSTETIKALGVPVSVIVGEEDQLSPPPVAEQMASWIPQADLTVIPEAGHLSPLERPAEVAAALRALHARSAAAQPSI